MRTGPGEVDSESGERDTAHLVRSLALTTCLLWLGASAILPLLPEYLRQQGSSDATIGIVMASYFVASLFGQYPAGRLADRVGRRPVLLAGLVVYAAGSVGFLAHLTPIADVGLRALQGLGAGAAEVASLAVISGSVALDRRGRAFGSIYAAQLSGMAIGPLAGSLAGVGSMNGIFVGACVAACAAAVPVATNRVLAADDVRIASSGAPSRMGLPHLNRALIGSLMAGAAFGLTIGVYESCWTLLLDLRQAHDWQIGLSWTLFAVPFVILARPGGWLADHLDRRWLAVGALSVSITLCILYPFIDVLGWLLALGAIEATGTVIALPAAQSLLTQTSAVSELGRVQGLYATAQTAAIAVAASAGGALFGVASWAPFVAGGVGAAGLTLSLPIVWRDVPGRAAAVAVGRDSPERAFGPPVIRADQA